MVVFRYGYVSLKDKQGSKQLHNFVCVRQKKEDGDDGFHQLQSLKYLLRVRCLSLSVVWIVDVTFPISDKGIFTSTSDSNANR